MSAANGGPGNPGRPSGGPVGMTAQEEEILLRIAASPHVHSPHSTPRIMWTVTATLVPLVAAAAWVLVVRSAFLRPPLSGFPGVRACSRRAWEVPTTRHLPTRCVKRVVLSGSIQAGGAGPATCPRLSGRTIPGSSKMATHPRAVSLS